MTMRQFPRRVGRWCRADVLALLLTSVLTVTASAHDPGLSSLDVSLTASTLVARLSLSPRDAEMAAALEPVGRFADAEWAGAAVTLDAFARRTIELQIDGQRLSACRAKVKRAGDATVIVELTYARPIGSRLTVRSRVAEQLASGHRELVTVREPSGAVVSERMIDRGDGGEPIALDVPGGSLDLARQFFALGLQHILSGYDHLLFLAGLLLGVHGVRGVVMTATAFTIGHSLTLASAVLGIVALPAGLVEPLIAASIAYVGVENLVSTNTSSRWRTALAFGLIHGFGFAGALQELGVGSGGVRTVVTLGFFNLGVEAGQVAVALMVLPMFWYLRTRQPLGLPVLRPCSGLVALCGACWFVARLVTGGAP
jgi:hydrogenase/urease accessory protein HupE